MKIFLNNQNLPFDGHPLGKYNTIICPQIPRIPK